MASFFARGGRIQDLIEILAKSLQGQESYVSSRRKTNRICFSEIVSAGLSIRIHRYKKRKRYFATLVIYNITQIN